MHTGYDEHFSNLSSFVLNVMILSREVRIKLLTVCMLPSSAASCTIISSSMSLRTSNTIASGSVPLRFPCWSYQVLLRRFPSWPHLCPNFILKCYVVVQILQIARFSMPCGPSSFIGSRNVCIGPREFGSCALLLGRPRPCV